MTATKPLTAAALYATSGTFRAAIAKWVADRRCPLELGDFLRENGLDAAADCADWCVAESDREIFNGGGRGGVFPVFDSNRVDGNRTPEWRFYVPEVTESPGWGPRAHWIPRGRVDPKLYWHVFYAPTVEEAIVKLLDGWKTGVGHTSGETS